jgi:hypothetical protein
MIVPVTECNEVCITYLFLQDLLGLFAYVPKEQQRNILIFDRYLLRTLRNDQTAKIWWEVTETTDKMKF